MNTYEITIKPQDRLIVTVQHEDKNNIKTVTVFHQSSVSAETSPDGKVRFISDWSFSDAGK